MAKKQLNETAASDTIVAKPMPQTSRAQMMLDVMNLFQWMDADKMTEALENVKTYASQAPDASAQNRASVQTGNKGSAIPTQAMREDIQSLFGSQELSEEFITKAQTILEATVNSKVLAEKAIMEEQYAQMLEEQIEETLDTIVEHIDNYLSLAAEEFMDQNKVAIDNSIRAELAEDFIGGLHKLFAEHYMTVPEGKEDVLEALADRVAELETKLNEQINENIEMTDILSQYAKQEIFDEVTEGLALTQVDRLKQLTEGVEFDGDVESYKKKLVTIKEHNFTAKATKQQFEADGSVSPEQLNEETARAHNPMVGSYVAAMDRLSRASVKR